MQEVREIRFILYEDEKKVPPRGDDITPEMESRWSRVFQEIEKILEYLDITPEVAKIRRRGPIMEVFTDYDFTFEHAIYVLKKLEEKFKVTSLDLETEYDEWHETKPHVCYGFYEK